MKEELEALQWSASDFVPSDGRPIQEGDVAVIDLIAADGSAQRDYVVAVGSDTLVAEIENGLEGLSPGESREIAYELADGSRRKVTVVLKELRERVLPPLDDELAKRASEFDTLAELKSDTESRLLAAVEDELEGLFRATAVDELVRATKFVAVGPLVETRTRELLTGLARSLEARGIDAGSYMEITGQTPEVLSDRLRAEASLSVSRELVLEAVADKLGIEVTDDDTRADLRDAGENDEDIEAFIAEGGADRVRDELRLKRALDRVAAEVKPIAPELHEARESIWTPEKEQPAETPKLWTPGS